MKDIIGYVILPNSKKILYLSTQDIGLNSPFYLNALTKLGILTTIAGYKKTDLIFFNDQLDQSINKQNLQRFLSYVLNHKYSAPRRYSLRINTRKGDIDTPAKQNMFRKKYDVIISYSGGIDSTAGILHALDKKKAVLPVFIDFGQFNSQSEFNNATIITRRLKLKLEHISLNIRSFIVDGWNEWGYIIPGRNFLLLTLSASYLINTQIESGNIFLCALREEMKYSRNTDKSQYFFDKVSEFFSKQFDKKITVTTPFSSIDKTQLLAYWRKHWMSKYRILPYETTTCYYADGCGNCEACLKRTINLIAAGFDQDPTIKQHPLLNRELINRVVIQPIKERRLDRERKLDFYITLERLYSNLPFYLQSIYNSLLWQTKRAIELRKQAIANVVLE